MPTTCTNCGADLPTGAGRCPRCLTLVEQPGFLRRVLGKFNIRLGVSADSTPEPPGHIVQTKRTIKTTSRIEIRDERTGQTKVYQSLDEVPSPYREKLAALRAAHAAGDTPTSEQITIREADGTERTYRSLDEVPPHMREFIERARRSGSDQTNS